MIRVQSVFEAFQMKILFGLNGFRGVVNDSLTPDIALKLGRAIGLYYNGPVAVASDTRNTADMVKNAVVAGLLAEGCNVFDLGVIPIPALQFYVKKHEDILGGVMITASIKENEAKIDEENAKLDKIKIDLEAVRAIEKRMEEGIQDLTNAKEKLVENKYKLENSRENTISSIDTKNGIKGTAADHLRVVLRGLPHPAGADGEMDAFGPEFPESAQNFVRNGPVFLSTSTTSSQVPCSSRWHSSLPS